MNNCKTIIASFLMALLFFQGRLASQTVMYGSNSNEIMNISSGELYMVFTGDKVFDNAFENSVKNYWKHTSYKTIKASEIEKHLGNNKNYFICLISSGDNALNIDRLNDFLDQEIVVFNGENNKLKKYSRAMMMVGIPFIIRNQKEYSFQTDYMVKALNDGIDIVKNASIEGLSEKIMYATLREVRKNAPILKQKTLLINKEQIFKDEIVLKYKYKYKVVSSEEILKLMLENNKDYCVLCEGGYPNKQIYIYDLETKKVVYGISSQGAREFNAKDFLKISEVIDGKENDEK